MIRQLYNFEYLILKSYILTCKSFLTPAKKISSANISASVFCKRFNLHFGFRTLFLPLLAGEYILLFDQKLCRWHQYFLF